MIFAQSIKTCFKKYATFSGRASRSEFWWWSLLCTIISFVIMSIDKMIGISVLQVIFCLATILPSIAVSVRRLHDTNRSALWAIILWSLMAIIYLNIMYPLNHTIMGIITLFLIIYPWVYIYFLCKKGTVGDNRFGKDPFQANLTKEE